MGMDIRIIGDTSIAIDAIASFFQVDDIKKYIIAAICELEAFGESENSQKAFERQMAKKICKIAKSRKKYFSFEEAKKIIENLFTCTSPYFDPLGASTIVKMEREDLSKFFSTKRNTKCQI